MRLSVDIYITGYMFYLAAYLILLSIYIHFTSLLATACYNSNTIDETAIVTRYFAIIFGVAKWHEVLFEGALLIKITTISVLFVFEYSTALGY